MAETHEGAREKFTSKVATKPAKKKTARRRPVTGYRNAFAGAAKRNSGGKY